jgi:hypothetical protein
MPSKTTAKPIFRWSEKSQRYIAPNGRFVARVKVLAELEKVRRGVGQEMRELARQLRDGEISRVEWVIAMKARIKALHLMHAAVAAGGLDKLTPADLGRVGAAVRRQYEFLRRWDAQNLPVDGRFIARAELYAGAAYGTFSDLERIKHKAAGYTEAKRVLGIAEHCPDCLEWANKWLPIDVIPPIGASVCRTNCRCTIIYR